uniref:Small ribosomal subunit protein bS6m n=1 Tax=Corethrella appendiculata TaxID=1370023 RepID=U5EXB1_9DIPT
MPTYELSMLLRQMSRPEVVSTLRRTADCIFTRGGIIRKIDNLGTKPTPYRMSSHGLVHRTASYFIFTFDTPPHTLDDINEELGRDVDVIRRHVYLTDKEETIPKCTLHEELLPPAYRKDVRDMVQLGQKYKKPKYEFKCGFDYYPFQT